MSKVCEYKHEDFCILECMLEESFEKHPCPFAKGKTLRRCTAKDKDLVEADEDM